MVGSLLVLLLARPLTIAAVGDVMLARWVGRRIERQGPAEMLRGVRSAMIGLDVVYGNLECALTNEPATARKNILLHANPATLPALSEFTVLSLVNNHALDCGQRGLDDAADRLRRAGITPLTGESAPITIRTRGIRTCFLGLMDLSGAHLSPGWRQRVAAARSACDLLVVGIHWGTEGSSKENHAQREVAAGLAAAGVDVVLGCHPHVLQPIRELHGPHGHCCLVAYSLGNFVFDSGPGPGSQSKILYVRATRQGVTAYATRRCTISGGFPKATAGALVWHKV
jgi:poly-gamma-glutamate capsule biosynthesis protein CapA/YwtB (metallophosphatase superfamily)